MFKDRCACSSREGGYIFCPPSLGNNLNNGGIFLDVSLGSTAEQRRHVKGIIYGKLDRNVMYSSSFFTISTLLHCKDLAVAADDLQMQECRLIHEQKRANNCRKEGKTWIKSSNLRLPGYFLQFWMKKINSWLCRTHTYTTRCLASSVWSCGAFVLFVLNFIEYSEYFALKLRTDFLFLRLFFLLCTIIIALAAVRMRMHSKERRKNSQLIVFSHSCINVARYIALTLFRVPPNLPLRCTHKYSFPTRQAHSLFAVHIQWDEGSNSVKQQTPLFNALVFQTDRQE